jgi:hypothetical protein
MRAISWRVLLAATLISIACPGLSSAEDKSIFSPIIHVDKGKGYIVVSSDGKVFAVEVDEAAKPHLEKLPVSGMIDMVVELRPGNTPLLKKWKVAGGESACKEFDGKNCK